MRQLYIILISLFICLGSAFGITLIDGRDINRYCLLDQTNNFTVRPTYNNIQFALVTDTNIVVVWGNITGDITNQPDLWAQFTNRYTKAEVDNLLIASGWYTPESEFGFDGTGTITNYTGTNAEVRIPPTIGGTPVISIGNDVFYNRTELVRIIIPEGVINIGNGVFAQCPDLTSVAIPDSVNSIGEYAFYLCSSLTSVTIPNGVTRLEESTFSDCHGLSNIVIPDSVNNIGRGTFSECTNLTSIVIPNGVTNIVRYAFWKCTNLLSVYFRGNAPTIDSPLTVFTNDPVTAYYIHGATGFDTWIASGVVPSTNEWIDSENKVEAVVTGTYTNTPEPFGQLHLEYIGTNLIPTEDALYDLGSPSRQWRSGYFSDGTIYIGGYPITSNKAAFWDSAIASNTQFIETYSNQIVNVGELTTNIFNSMLAEYPTSDWDTAYAYINGKSNSIDSMLGRTGVWNQASVDSAYSTNWISTNGLLAEVGRLTGRTGVWNQASIDSSYSTNWISTNGLLAAVGRLNGRTGVWNQASVDSAYSTNWISTNGLLAAVGLLNGRSNDWNSTFDWVVAHSNDVSGYSNLLANTTAGQEGFRLIGVLGGYSLDEMLEDTGLKGPSRDLPTFLYTLTNVAPNLTVGWTSGDVYAPKYGYFHINAGTNTLTDFAVNYSYWDISAPNTVSWATGSRPIDSDDNIYLATFYCGFGLLGAASIAPPGGNLPALMYNTSSYVLPSIIVSGVLYSPVGSNLNDVIMSPGVEYQDMVSRVTHPPRDLRNPLVTPYVMMMYHTNVSMWGYILTNQVPIGLWDTGSNIAVCATGKWYRGIWASIAVAPYMIYTLPDQEFDDYAAAVAGSDPMQPSGYDPCVVATTAYIFKGDDTTLRDDAGLYWLDRRAMFRKGVAGSGGSSSGTTPSLYQVLLSGRSTGGLLPNGAGNPSANDELACKGYVDTKDIPGTNAQARVSVLETNTATLAQGQAATNHIAQIGTNVHGLGTAATNPASAFATAAQGQAATNAQERVAALEGGKGWYTPESSFVFDGVGSITGYSGTNAELRIPRSIGGVPVTAIDNLAFQGRTNIVRLVLPESVMTVGAAAFEECGELTSADMPGAVLIGHSAFKNCYKLASISVPKVAYIEDNAFISCFGLTSVSLPSVHTIGAGGYSFFNCTNLVSVSMPVVTWIAPMTFLQCSNLASVYFSSNAPTLGMYVDSGVFSNTAPAIAYYPQGRTGYDTWGYTNTNTWVQSDNIYSLAVNGVSPDADGDITIQSGQLWYTPESEFGFSSGTITSYSGTNAEVRVPRTIGGIVVAAISTNVFEYNTTISSVVLPNDLVDIKSNAFSHCTNLVSVIAPSVTNIGQYSFYRCWSLTNVYAPNVSTLGFGAFRDCSLTSISMPRLTTLSGIAFFGNEELTYANFPNVTSFSGDYVFSDCSNLVTVTLPNLTDPHELGFYECVKLSSISIPKIKYIPPQFFKGCTSLTSIVLSETVTNIGQQAFLNCVGPMSVYYKGNGPARDTTPFTGTIATHYYLQGRTGFDGVGYGTNTNTWVTADSIYSLAVNGVSPDADGDISLGTILTNGSSPSFRDVTVLATLNGSATDLTGLTRGQTNLYTITKDPSGWAGVTDAIGTYLFNNTTRIFTLTNAAGMSAYRNGQLLTNATTLSWPAISTNQGVWYVKFTQANGAMDVSQTAWSLDDIQVATVYWTGGSNGTAYVGEETHGMGMDWATHQRFHLVPGQGSSIVTPIGFPLTISTTNYSVGTGRWIDEDILHTIGSAYSTGYILWGSNGVPILTLATNRYFLTNAATQDLRYNIGGTNLADVSTGGGGQYMAMYLYVTPLVDTPYVWVMGRNQATTTNAIALESPPDMTGLFPSGEALLLYKVILRGPNNAPMFSTSVDYRSSQVTGSGSTTGSHPTLSNRDAADSHPLSAISDYTTIAYLGGTNAFTGTNTFNAPVISGASGLTNAVVWNTTGNAVVPRGTNYLGTNGIFFTVGTTNYIITFP